MTYSQAPISNNSKPKLKRTKIILDLISMILLAVGFIGAFIFTMLVALVAYGFGGTVDLNSITNTFLGMSFFSLLAYIPAAILALISIIKNKSVFAKILLGLSIIGIVIGILGSTIIDFS